MAVTRDEVIWAYRMILGREPENEDAINSNLLAVNLKALRERLLKSEEFSRTSTPTTPADRLSGISQKPNLSEKKIVFVHIPKCAGTTITQYITNNAPDWKVCPERFAGLSQWPAKHLASYNFFTGHFDYLSAQMVPGESKFIFSTFREPISRLRSFYYFSRSHRPELPQHAKLALVQLANTHSITEFLKAPELHDSININNSFARTFLDRRTVDGDRELLTESEKTNLLNTQPDLATDIAINNIKSLSAVILMNDLDSFAPKLLELMGIQETVPLRHEQVLTDLTEKNAALREVKKQEETDETKNLLEFHTKVDRVIYGELASEYGLSG
ncbi:MAG: sulfotransferase family 2 domain-containing protein [Pseudomonadota bacterium]